MNIDEVIINAQKHYQNTVKYVKSLSEVEQQQIKKNELELSYKVKELLDKRGVDISDIYSRFDKDYVTKDEKIINVYVTRYTSSYSQRTSTVVFDAQTLKMLYIQTGVMKFVSPKDFFDIDE